MKIKFLIIFLISSISIYSQISKTEKENILLIVGCTNPGIAEFLIQSRVNSSFLLIENDFDFKYGEYTIIEKPVSNDTLHYNEFGFLKFDYLKTERGSHFDYNYLDFPIQIGSKGEMKNKQNYKYKYNQKGQIIELFKYSNDGSEIEGHYGFSYNEKNQIFEVKHYWINNTIAKDISSYTYNSFGDIVLMKNYSLTTNKNLPKSEHFKLIWNYNSKNQLISYHSYETNYGYYWDIGRDLYKYVNGKKIPKTYVEHQKDLNKSYQEIQNYEYKYDDNTNVWTSRIEYSTDKYSTIQKKYIRILYQKQLE